MAVIDGTGIKYREDLGSLSVYEVWMFDRLVIEVVVDNDDVDLKIWVGKPGAAVFAHTVGLDAAMRETGGRAQKSMHIVGGGEGVAPDGVHEHIDGVTVQSYVAPRIARFVVEFYVPKQSD